MDDKLTIFIALTSVAILIQAGVLLAMYIAMRKSSQRMEALATEVKGKIMPSLDQAEQLLTEMRPKLTVIVDNLQEATTVMRSELKRVDATVNDVVDRARLQVIRADELLSRTLDKVEHTSEMVQKTVVSPVRHISGLMQGISVGLEILFAGRGRRNGGGREERRPVPQDEMFI
jgi:ABC-type transporter Mla subunit MlaD